MRRIGSSLAARFGILSLILLLIPFGRITLAQQDFQLEATVSENKIFIGEQFNLRVEVSGSSMRDVSLPVVPDIEGIGLLSQMPSRSSSISIVNGRTTTSTTYSYGLIAREKGFFTIPPVTIEIDGQEYRTESIQVEVIEKGQLSSDGNRQLPEIFLEVEIDEQNPVPGQQIVASVQLFFKQGIEVTSFQPNAGWRTDGFWKEELQNIRQPQAESVILEGVRFRTATLIRYALFPTRSGELTLSEFPLNVGIRTQSARNDPFGSFFGSAGSQRRVTLESEPITIDVRDIPSAPNALSMNAVGDLSIERTLATDNVMVGETLELTTRVNGEGNIPLVRKPEYNFPDNLELYTPQESSNIERRGLTISGEKVFTELLAPRAPGDYEIPAERIAVFDPGSGNYDFVNLPALRYTVHPGGNVQNAVSYSDGSQIQPVTGLAVWHEATSESIFSRFWFWLLFIIPFAGLIVAIRKKRLLMKLSTDKEFARAHRAADLAHERLEYARSIVDEAAPKEIYNILHKALFGYLTDKFHLPEAGLSDQELIQEVRKSEIEEAQQSQIKKMLDKCATISFAPSGDRTDYRSDIIRTEKLISELNEQL
ncbi:BatD family protein [Rhodohalobacter sulfatireducens]|uniref:BatD family protein n=1 Tax=Rhodohalobacter sulfatireducens TaxID=2911366 RepID=A0ABS9K9Y1_9BACT|nr:BatD family protein [Rhodohalobacter sulfatireducens]MCG2587628.1 BatD family protein [Rhodohalobacter sulfatireducens]